MGRSASRTIPGIDVELLFRIRLALFLGRMEPRTKSRTEGRQRSLASLMDGDVKTRNYLSRIPTAGVSLRSVLT